MELRIVKMMALVALWMGMTVGLRAQTVVEYIHTDALGTPVAITDATGTVIERSVYEPYGQLINRPLTDGPGFTGHVQDAATGLTYMQQRYYDPGIGRFLSVDPINADGSTGDNFNRYAYVENNPYAFTDPDGRYPRFISQPPNFSQSFSIASNLNDRFGFVRGKGRETPPDKYESPEEERERRERERSEKRQQKQDGKKGKYKAPPNENKRPPPEHRKPSGSRERNVGHPDGEEHSIKPKGGVFLRLPYLFCPLCPQLLQQVEPPPTPPPA